MLPESAERFGDCAATGLEVETASSSVGLGDEGLVLLFAEREVVIDSDETGREAKISSMRTSIENITNGDLCASAGKNELRVIGREGGDGGLCGDGNGGRGVDIWRLTAGPPADLLGVFC